jgi:hypothetical protein
VTDRTGEFSPLSCDNNYRCNVARDFVPGCFNRYIFVLAEIDARVARTEEVVLHPFVPRHRYGPVVLVATVPVVVPTSSSAAATTTAAASASFAAVLVPTAASVARLLRFLPAIITGQVTLPFLKAATAAAATAGATASTPIIVSFERLAILVASIPAQKKIQTVNIRSAIATGSETNLRSSGATISPENEKTNTETSNKHNPGLQCDLRGNCATDGRILLNYCVCY